MTTELTKDQKQELEAQKKEKRDNMIKTIKEDAECILDIATNNPDKIIGYNQEDSQFNKGINISLKRD